MTATVTAAVLGTAAPDAGRGANRAVIYFVVDDDMITIPIGPSLLPTIAPTCMGI